MEEHARNGLQQDGSYTLEITPRRLEEQLDALFYEDQAQSAPASDVEQPATFLSVTSMLSSLWNGPWYKSKCCSREMERRREAVDMFIIELRGWATEHMPTLDWSTWIDATLTGDQVMLRRIGRTLHGEAEEAFAQFVSSSLEHAFQAL